MTRIRNWILVIAGFALGWWIVSQVLEWMSPKPVPADGMQTREVHPYETTPGTVATVADVSEPATDDVEDEAPATEEVTSSRDGDTSDQADTSEQDEEAPVVYCLRCREKRTITNWRYETMENGRRRIIGECTVCGGGVSQFVKSE